MGGFVLKSHYSSTAERARVVRAAVPASTCSARSASTAPSAGSTRWRSRSPPARARARSGSRPSTRSTSPTSAGAAPGAKVPVWVKLQLELREQGIEIEPVAVVDAESGSVLPETREVLNDDRAPRDGARDRSPLPRRDLHRRRMPRSRRACDDRRHASRVSLPEPGCRRPDRRSRHRARCWSAASRRRTRARSTGSRWLENIRATGARATRSSRPISARCSTHRSRTGWR